MDPFGPIWTYFVPFGANWTYQTFLSLFGCIWTLLDPLGPLDPSRLIWLYLPTYLPVGFHFTNRILHLDAFQSIKWRYIVPENMLNASFKHPLLSFKMKCNGDIWTGFYTDACMRPNCDNITGVVSWLKCWLDLSKVCEFSILLLAKEVSVNSGSHMMSHVTGQTHT